MMSGNIIINNPVYDYRKFFFVAFLALVMFTPFFSADAQGPGATPFVCKDGTKFSLAPDCGCITGSGADAEYHSCEACHLFQVIENIINLVVLYLAVPLAAIAFAVAGFKYITAAGNSGQISQAHSIFKNVAIGLIIILASWLLVDTIMKTLVQDKSFLPWDGISCIQKPKPSPVPGTSIRAGPGLQPGVNFSSGPVFQQLSRHEAVTRLTLSGIDVDSDECVGGSTAGCTSLNGVQQSTIEGLVALKAGCDKVKQTICTFTVTSGTEGTGGPDQFGHTSGGTVSIGSNLITRDYLVGLLIDDGHIESATDLEPNTLYGPVSGPNNSEINIGFTNPGSPTGQIVVQVVSADSARQAPSESPSLPPAPSETADSADNQSPPSIPLPGGPPTGP